jgi:hypothetical protein
MTERGTKLKIIELVQTSNLAPEQYEGKIENSEYKFVYIRRRHGYFSVGIGRRSLEQAVDNDYLSGPEELMYPSIDLCFEIPKEWRKNWGLPDKEIEDKKIKKHCIVMPFTSEAKATYAAKCLKDYVVLEKLIMEVELDGSEKVVDYVYLEAMVKK